MWTKMLDSHLLQSLLGQVRGQYWVRAFSNELSTRPLSRPEPTLALGLTLLGDRIR